MGTLNNHLFKLPNLIFWILFINSGLTYGVLRNGQPPVFIREPPNHVYFVNNSSITVHCMVNGQPSPLINWYQKKLNNVIPVFKQQPSTLFTSSNKNTDNLFQQTQKPPLVEQRTDGSLHFSAFSPELYGLDVHSSIYFCEATNQFGTIRSRDVHIRALIAQSHRAEVFDEYVIPGNSALFKCSLPSTLKDFVYVSQWIIDQNETIARNSLSFRDRYTVLSNGELYIKQISEKDISSTFACETRNRLTGETSLSSTKGRLYLTPTQNKLAPRIIYSQNTIRIDEGESVILPCISQAYPLPNYQWFQIKKHPQWPLNEPTPQQQIIDQIEPIHTSSRIFQLDGLLVFKQALISDNGKYRCVVNNSIGTALIETELIVTSPLFAEIIPNEITADVGSTIQFNCSIQGYYPIISIEWYHNGKPLYHLDNRIRLINKNTLIISKVQRIDRGIYQCIVNSEKDNVQASTVLDLGDDAPTLLETFPVNQVIDPTSSISLKCVATGVPLPQVTWTLDNYPLLDDNRYRIGDYVTSGGLLVSYVNITSAKIEFSGKYECLASNEIGSVSHQGRLNINGPVIVRPMPNRTVVGGEKVVINCPVGGYPIESISWEKNNWKIPFNHRQKSFPNGTLHIYQVERDHDEGQYTCLAKGKQGSIAKNSFFLTVLVKPVIDEFVFPKSLHEGQRYNVLCTVIKGDPQGLEIQWLKDGQPLFSNNNNFNNLNLKSNQLNGVTVTQVTEFSSMLNFASLHSEHRGNYSCKASNLAGHHNHTSTMIIQVPPSWLIEPTDSTVIKGTTSSISCQANGYPSPRIRWSKSTSEEFLQDASSDFKAISSSPHVRVFENGSLIIHNTQKSDQAYYLCTASNGIGPGLSKVVRVTVHTAAHFKTKFKAETVQKGSDVRLRCEAYGDKPLTINWTKDKLLFNAKDDVRYELIENLNSESLISELLIQDTNRRDSSLFTCIASNAYGEDQTSIQLILQEPPDIPEKVKINDITGRSAILNWKTPFNGNSIILYYLIEYQQADDNWNNRNAINILNVTGNDNQILIKGLKPITQYQVRVYAQNALGKSEASEISVFRTDEELPTGAPQEIKALPISSTQIKLNWKPPKKELQNGLITGYYVGFKLKSTGSTPKMNEQFQFKTINTKVNEFEHEFILKNLKKSSTYSITIQAINSKGAGTSSEEVIAQTHENDPPPPPILKIISSSSNTIQITWHFEESNLIKINDDQNKNENNQIQQSNTSISTEINLPIIAYVLHFKLQNADNAQWQELRLPGDRSSYLFENLRCGSKYQFYIYAINSIDKGESSEIIIGKTEGMGPVAPDKHSLLSVNSTAVSIFLESFHNGGCPITKFEIMYKMQRAKKWINLPMSENDLEFRRVFITNLKPSTNYDLIITAENPSGSTNAKYSFSTFTQMKENAITHILANNEASSSSAEDIYLNVGFILPSCISILIILLVVLLLCVLVAKKKNNSASIYGSTLYDTAKQSNIDTLRLSDLNNGNLKKVSENGSSGLDSGYSGLNSHYPSPYSCTEMKLNGKNLSEACLNSEALNDLTCNGLSENQINTKLIERMLTDATSTFANHNSPKKNEGEPLYATVKRNGRALRTDLHVYHCPAGTLKNNLFDTQISNCESMLSVTNGTLNGNLVNGNLMNGNLNGNLMNGKLSNHTIYGTSLCTVNSSCSNQSDNYVDQQQSTIYPIQTDCKESIAALGSISEESISHCQNQLKQDQQFNNQQQQHKLIRAQDINNILTYQRRMNNKLLR